ncbi:SAM-dependent methyltransferase [Paenibacillus piri]|uniref:SAM-dependent methyltransferase n=2 Tax=Paenibacillus piri TaxID=2547395 RepID=A0A4R5KMH2_9BACL|nr:SAM-dependent methyltransferase [Paenibacillus piri]
MELCLYHPLYGYYMKNKEKVGTSGDFYTSSAIGGLFGEVLAQYIAGQAKLMGLEQPITLIEWGGGSGQLAQQLLDELRRSWNPVYERLTYISVETSSYHRELQAVRLASHEKRVSWRTGRQWLEEGPWNRVIVFSNELIDAFPVHRVQIKDGQPYEIFTEWDEAGGHFREKLLPLKDGSLAAALEELRRQRIKLAEGQRLELNLAASAWIRQIAGAIRSGQLVTIDYGDRAEELYAPHRMQGTLMCYRNHLANDNPYADPGHQDITSHVDFSGLIRDGGAAGLRLAHYMTQKQFLVENGLLQKLQDTASQDPFSPAARRNRAVRQLLLSDQMSELFKVLIQKKDELP